MVLNTHEAHSLSKKQMVRITVVVKVIEYLLYFRCFLGFLKHFRLRTSLHF